MLNIAIVEDDRLWREELNQQLQSFFARQQLQAQVDLFEGGPVFLKACSQTLYQLAFLDIYMGDSDGIAVARQLRTLQPDCAVVFVTSSTERAVEGFQVRAFHYLLKPCNPLEIQSVLEEFLKTLSHIERVLELPVGRDRERIPVSTIAWANNYQHQVHLGLTDGRNLATRMTFRDFSQLLIQEDRFFICSQGSLVNLDQVLDFDGIQFQMPGRITISVSRDRRRAAKTALSEWLFKKLCQG